MLRPHTTGVELTKATIPTRPNLSVIRFVKPIAFKYSRSRSPHPCHTDLATNWCYMWIVHAGFYFSSATTHYAAIFVDWHLLLPPIINVVNATTTNAFN